MTIMGRPDTGISGDAGEVRIHAQLRRIQADRCQAQGSEREHEAQRSEEQALSTCGVSGAEGAGGREVRAFGMRSRWTEVLPVHSRG